MAAYDVINGYDPIRSIVFEGRTWWYQARIPTGASAGTPLGVIFWLAQASHTAANFGTPGLQATAQACINDQRGDSFGVRIDTGNHAGYIVIFLPEYDGTDASRLSWRSVFRLCIDDMVAFGYNLNLRRVNACGWSTGAIQWQYIAATDPALWHRAWIADGTMVSAAITNWGAGAPHGIFATDVAGNVCYDPPVIAVGANAGDGNPSTDTFMLREMARLMYLWGVSFVHGMANNDSATKSGYLSFWGRLINDFADQTGTQATSLIEELAALGAVTTTTTGPSSTAITVAAGTQFSQRYVDNAEHGPTNDFMFNATNWPTALAWFNEVQKPLTLTWVAPATPSPIRTKAVRVLI